MAQAPPRGLFVTGTDTGVGKTIACASLIAAMTTAGERVTAHKPVLTGTDQTATPWPADHELLADLAGMEPSQVAPRRFGAAVAPLLAAELAAERLDAERLLSDAHRALHSARSEGCIAIFEGVGGLLVPLADGLLVRDLAFGLELPVLIAARPGLGTINHTLLTLEAARAAGLEVAGVVLSPWQIEGSSVDEDARVLERSNRETIARLGEVQVTQMAYLSGPSDDLAGAGAALPWRDWISAHGFSGARISARGSSAP
jgi:dethiobiotin synthetase